MDMLLLCCRLAKPGRYVSIAAYNTDWKNNNKRTWWQPPNATASSKKGVFNTPSIIQFFEKENGGFDLSQNRRLAVFSIFGRKIATATTAVFFYRRAAPFFYKQ